MEKTLLDEIMTLKDVLPKKQRILCQYLALNYERVGVMTVAELAPPPASVPPLSCGWYKRLDMTASALSSAPLADVVLLKNTSSYRGAETELCQHQGDREQRYLPLGGCRQPAHRGKPLYSLKY